MAEQRSAGFCSLNRRQESAELRSAGQPGAAVPTWSYAGNSLSILAAMMKSLWVRPSILCVHIVISALPQVSRMSG